MLFFQSSVKKVTVTVPMGEKSKILIFIFLSVQIHTINIKKY